VRRGLCERRPLSAPPEQAHGAEHEDAEGEREQADGERLARRDGWPISNNSSAPARPQITTDCTSA
jgi:hypothetical protein